MINCQYIQMLRNKPLSLVYIKKCTMSGVLIQKICGGFQLEDAGSLSSQYMACVFRTYTHGILKHPLTSPLTA